MKPTTILLSVLTAALTLTALAVPMPAAAQCGETITHLGGRSTAIVPGGVKDAKGMLEALENPKVQSMLMEAIQQGLALEGMPVDRDRDFRIYGEIVYQAKQLAEANAAPRDYGKGTQLLWMAYRKDGEVTLLDKPCWGASRPMQAWEVPVRLDGKIYQFIMPRQCINLSAQSESIPDPDYVPPAPPKEEAECKLRASADNETGIITLDASGSKGTVTIVGVTNGGQRMAPDVTSTGANQWRFPSQGEAPNGDYVFTAEAKTKDETKTCEATAQMTPPTIACNLAATVTDDRHINVAVTPQDVEVEGMRVEYTLNPSGKTGSASLDDGSHMWLFPARGKAKPGSYNFVADVRGRRDGKGTCTSGDVEVPIPPFPTWTVRAYGARLDTSADEFFLASTDPATNTIPIREHFNIENGSGFGFGLEYRPTQKIGVEAGLLLASLDASYKLDIGSDWAMDQDDVDFTAFTLGLNFHPLETSGRFDLFLGPFIGFSNFDDADFSALGTTKGYDFDGGFLWGAQIGFDLLFTEGGPWAFTSALRYLETSAEENSFEIDLDELILSAGIAYRFPR